MGKRLENLGNRFGNTVRIPTRLGKTVLNTVTDLVDAVEALPKDALDVIHNTAHSMSDILTSAWTTGKRYQRVGNILLSPFVALGTAVEGAARTVLAPSVNLVANTWNTGKNTVTNTARSTFGRVFSKKPISSFSYDKLKTANIINKHSGIANWRFHRKSFGKGSGKTDDGERARVDPIITPKTGTEHTDPSKGGKGTESADRRGKLKNRANIEKAKRMLNDSPAGQKTIDKLYSHYKNFGIKFDDSTSSGKIRNNIITVGTKMPDREECRAPTNRNEKNPKYQKVHVLLHELSHCIINEGKGDAHSDTKKGLDIIKRYIESDKKEKTLTRLSYKNRAYATSDAKAKEDFAEILALSMTDKRLERYIDFLSSDKEEHKLDREKFGLVTISKEDAKALLNICKSIIKKI